jgi:hypothetical protein
VIVEPWFTAVGHPAQTLLNTARVLGRRDDVTYVIAYNQGRPDLEAIVRELREYGAVKCVECRDAAPALSTFRCMLAVARGSGERRRVLFMDAHILVLATFAPLFRALARGVDWVAVLGLHGPESLLAASAWRRLVIKRWLRQEEVRLFLRTRELVAAWSDALPEVRRGQIDTLPSLEIPLTDGMGALPAQPMGATRFAVIGQIRTGKSLEWLVPLFEAHREIGELRVSGAFFNAEQRSRLPMLAGFAGFDDRFIPDEQLVPRAAESDYLLTLYDSWDHRLEAATFYLAARARRPVIAYDKGWCGRMINQYGCGIAIREHMAADADFFANVPQRNSDEYRRMQAGIDEFHRAHSAQARRAEFIEKVWGCPVGAHSGTLQRIDDHPEQQCPR